MLALHGRELVGVGKMSMDLKTYNDVLDILKITTRRISEKPTFTQDFGEKWELF